MTLLTPFGGHSPLPPPGYALPTFISLPSTLPPRNCGKSRCPMKGSPQNERITDVGGGGCSDTVTYATTRRREGPAALKLQDWKFTDLFAERELTSGSATVQFTSRQPCALSSAHATRVHGSCSRAVNSTGVILDTRRPVRTELQYYRCVSFYGRPIFSCCYLFFLSSFLWPPYVIGGGVIFLPCSFFLSSIYLLLFFPRLISAATDWMSTILWHMVWP